MEKIPGEEQKKWPNPLVRLIDLLPAAKDNGLLDPENLTRHHFSVEYGEIFSASPHSESFYNDLTTANLKRREATRELFRFFRDQIVIDLGAGKRPWGLRIAEEAGARGYIAVEKYNFDDCYRSVKYGWLERRPEINSIPASVVAEDMLVFLDRLPDRSASFFLCNIDENVIRFQNKRNSIASEMARVLHPAGAIVEVESPFYDQNLSSETISQTIKDFNKSDRIEVFRRKS